MKDDVELNNTLEFLTQFKRKIIQTTYIRININKDRIRAIEVL